MVNSNRYNKYLNTILIAFETLLCGALFLANDFPLADNARAIFLKFQR